MAKKTLVFDVIRDSADLGLDKGMTCRFVRSKGDAMTLYCPEMDATIDGVKVGHPDLRVR